MRAGPNGVGVPHLHVVTSLLVVCLLWVGLVASEEAEAASSRTAKTGSVRVTVTGLPSSQPAHIVLKRNGQRPRQLTRSSTVRNLRSGTWTLVVSSVRLKKSAGSAKARAKVLPVKRKIAVRIRGGRHAKAKAAYGTIINPNARAVPKRIQVVGDPTRPSALLVSPHQAPRVGALLSSGPSRALPQGLVARVTAVRRQGASRRIALTPVPVTDVAPVIRYDGPLQTPGGRFTARAAATGLPFGFSVDYAVAGPCGLTGGDDLTPSFDLGRPRLNVDVRATSWGGGPKADLIISSRPTVKVRLRTRGGIFCQQDIIAPTWYVGAVPTVPPIPVYVSFPLTLRAEISGAGTANASVSWDMAVGFRARRQGPRLRAQAVFAASRSSGTADAWLARELKVVPSFGAELGFGVRSLLLNANVSAQLGTAVEYTHTIGGGCAAEWQLGRFQVSGKIGRLTLSHPEIAAQRLPLNARCITRPDGGSTSPEPGPSAQTPAPPSPVAPPKGPATAIAEVVSVGGTHSCALHPGGTISCWGDNYYGQLGDGTTTDSTTPVGVTGISDAAEISTGHGYSCALRSGGTISCWGALEARTNTSTPTPVEGIGDAVALSSGSGHSCAVRQSGQVACWGSNLQGELGDGSTTASGTPVAVQGLADALGVSAGGASSCALRATGHVACWGYNGGGELGNGTTTSSRTPVAVQGLSDAVGVSVGAGHSCAARETGQIVCWGYNPKGQLGDGSTASSPTPVLVQGVGDAVAISAGNHNSCAVRQNGRAACWGDNQSGQLGDGTTSSSLTPVGVRDLEDATAISAGGFGNESPMGGPPSEVSCAFRSTGQIACWGANHHGQLGNGTTTNSTSPVTVVGMP